MARPKKQTVDYFPHEAKSGRTLYILESRWGILGYAFWFKLLETLCDSEGHVFNYGDPAEREYFLAKTHTDDKTATDILEKLVEMGKIDKELWQKKSLIWCQNLVNNIKDAYSKRVDSLPKKPVSGDGNNINCNNQEFPLPENPENEVCDSGSTESKVKETKVNKIKEKESREELLRAREDTPPVDNSYKLPEEAWDEVVSKVGDTTKRPEWSNSIIGWVVHDIGGSMKIAHSNPDEFKGLFIDKYSRLLAKYSGKAEAG